jgi:hypothetical protein
LFHLECDIEDEVPIRFSLETRGAVAEVAISDCECDDLPLSPIEGPNSRNHFTHFMSVCADVLDRSSTYCSWNPSKGLDTDETLCVRPRDEFIPILTCLDGNQSTATGIALYFDPFGRYLDHSSCESCIRNEDVGAATDDEEWYS